MHASPQIAPGTRAVIITGPNTGGKTATLKALGLAALAARCGLPVPAAAPALLPCFDAVLAGGAGGLRAHELVGVSQHEVRMQ